MMKSCMVTFTNTVQLSNLLDYFLRFEEFLLLFWITYNLLYLEDDCNSGVVSSTNTASKSLFQWNQVESKTDFVESFAGF